MWKRFIGYALLIITVLPLAARAEESLDHLAQRIKLSRIQHGIEQGDRSVFKQLPAKGYRDGIAGLMRRYNVYAIPEYSFTQCGETYKGTGCIVSIKLGEKSDDGSYIDKGIRVEFAIHPGERNFVPNNSMWAKHAMLGDGAFDASDLATP